MTLSEAKERLERGEKIISINDIINTAKANQKTVIKGFGTFSKKVYETRKGRNPKSGAEVVIPAFSTIKFKPSKELRHIFSSGFSSKKENFL